MKKNLVSNQSVTIKKIILLDNVFDVLEVSNCIKFL